MQFINNGILEIMARIQSAQNRDEEGAAMAEYGLLLALVAVVGAVTLALLGTKIADKFTAVTTALG
jgi:Flp pilus assembly pilin Flp